MMARTAKVGMRATPMRAVTIPETRPAPATTTPRTTSTRKTMKRNGNASRRGSTSKYRKGSRIRDDVLKIRFGQLGSRK